MRSDAKESRPRRTSEHPRCVVSVSLKGLDLVLDALIPSVRALEVATSDEGLAAMIAAARRGIDETTPSVSRRGRAAWLGERAQGHPDPGAVAYLRFLEALQRSLGGTGRSAGL